MAFLVVFVKIPLNCLVQESYVLCHFEIWRNNRSEKDTDARNVTVWICCNHNSMADVGHELGTEFGYGGDRT